MTAPPSPAIVPQSAVPPLPRGALLFLCLIYTLAGFVGRDPWRNADITAFAYMHAMASGNTTWLEPLLLGMPPEHTGLLPYWLGAGAIVILQALGGWLPLNFSAEMAARLPFIGLLALTLLATWHGMYWLARTPAAQPAALAFGGEAQPADYARAMADAAILALIACLGLAQLTHETTTSLSQLACTTLLLFAAAALPQRLWTSLTAAGLGLTGLVLSGAPTLALLLGLGSLGLLWYHHPTPEQTRQQRQHRWACTALLAWLLAAAILAWMLDVWRWHVVGFDAAKPWGSVLRLLIWFLWPAWPLTVWTLWRWRDHLASRTWPRHLLLPLWFALVTLLATITTPFGDRVLLLGLPAYAMLAAFAIPTLKRSMAALIDWGSLLFFSICALAIWIIWLSVHTGVPAKPAANVAKLALGYTPEFSLLPFIFALAATVSWSALVCWYVARTRAALWKSLILPASGATLSWLLMMTLWLPLLNYGRSFVPHITPVAAALKAAGVQPEDCVVGYGLTHAQMVALQYHGKLHMVTPDLAPLCAWAIADAAASPPVHLTLPPGQWRTLASIVRPTDRHDWLLVLERTNDVSFTPQETHDDDLPTR